MVKDHVLHIPNKINCTLIKYSVQLFTEYRTGNATLLHCNENPIYVFFFWELRGFSPNFHSHVSVSDLHIIFPGSVHIFPAAE
jgi:hypothetical protein